MAGGAVDPIERGLQASEAHASATLLATLTLLWGIIALFLVPTQFRDVDIGHFVIGAIGLAYFWRTRHRPRPLVAYGYGALAIVQTLVLLPWTTVVWCALGRPFEAVTVPQLAIVCMALIVPRSLAAGIVVMILFLCEGLFVTVWAHHVGVEQLLPVGEPLLTPLFCLPAIGLLVLRERRRQLARRYLKLQADKQALGALGPLFFRVRQELRAQLYALSDELGAVGNGGTAAASSIERAVERLGDVDAKLETPGLQPSATAGLERAFLAGDAQLGAGIMALITVFVAAVWSPFAYFEFGLGFAMRIAVLGLFAATLLLFLVATRGRPSERRSRAVLVILYLVVLAGITVNQRAYVSLGRPYTPFLGHKLMMVILGLAAASRASIGVPLIVATAADAIVLYFVLHLNALKDRIALVEPWVTLVFMVVGIAALIMRDQRRIESVALLRAESEATTLHRRAVLLLSLRDQLNTPLQTLVLGATRLEMQEPGRDVSRIRAAIARLVALSRELAQIELPRESQVASLGAGELGRAG